MYIIFCGLAVLLSVFFLMKTHVTALQKLYYEILMKIFPSP